jgi:surface polysaccharide O-acyltransferase-like enzyme
MHENQIGFQYFIIIEKKYVLVSGYLCPSELSNTKHKCFEIVCNLSCISAIHNLVLSLVT